MRRFWTHVFLLFIFISILIYLFWNIHRLSLFYIIIFILLHRLKHILLKFIRLKKLSFSLISKLHSLCRNSSILKIIILIIWFSWFSINIIGWCFKNLIILAFSSIPIIHRLSKILIMVFYRIYIQTKFLFRRLDHRLA